MRLMGEPESQAGVQSIEERLKRLGLEGQAASEGEDDVFEEGDSNADSDDPHGHGLDGSALGSSESSDVWEDSE